MASGSLDLGVVPTSGGGGSGITALTGDVTASGSGSVAATVAAVGGSTASNVNAATVLANAATSSATASAIAKRDANGLILANVQGAVNTQTGTTYLLLAADNGKTITFENVGAVTVTCPVLTQGFWCNVIQKGAGQVGFVTSSTTLRNGNTQTKLANQYAVGTIFYEATNVFYLAGQTGP